MVFPKELVMVINKIFGIVGEDFKLAESNPLYPLLFLLSGVIGFMYVINWKNEAFADNTIYSRVIAAIAFPYLVVNHKISKGFLIFGVVDFLSAMVYMYLKRSNAKTKNS